MGIVAYPVYYKMAYTGVTNADAVVDTVHDGTQLLSVVWAARLSLKSSKSIQFAASVLRSAVNLPSDA
jgi:hypothetical protein